MPREKITKTGEIRGNDFTRRDAEKDFKKNKDATRRALRSDGYTFRMTGNMKWSDYNGIYTCAQGYQASKWVNRPLLQSGRSSSHVEAARSTGGWDAGRG